jgi:hypothetical protein
MKRPYSGIAAIPKASLSRVDALAPSHRSAVSAKPYGRSYFMSRKAHADDVGLSPVNVVSHFAKVKPPNTCGGFVESPYLSTNKAA